MNAVRRVAVAVLAASALSVTMPSGAEAATYYTVGRIAGHHGCSTTLAGTARVQCLDGWRKSLKPCKAEDSRNCYWNAKVRSNGKGHSFVNVAGTVYRVKGVNA